MSQSKSQSETEKCCRLYHCLLRLITACSNSRLQHTDPHAVCCCIVIHKPHCVTCLVGHVLIGICYTNTLRHSGCPFLSDGLAPNAPPVIRNQDTHLYRQENRNSHTQSIFETILRLKRFLCRLLLLPRPRYRLRVIAWSLEGGPGLVMPRPGPGRQQAFYRITGRIMKQSLTSKHCMA
jgi:hypothetical protein